MIANISNLVIDRLTIRGVDIDPSVVISIDLFEGLTNPGVTGTIVFKDWQGLREIGEVFAGDDFDFSWRIQGKPPIIGKYKIYADDGASVDENSTFHRSVFHFCSPWLIDGFTRQVSKPYKDKFIHEIVEDLLKEIGCDIGFIEPTQQKLNNFVTPLWTVPHSIKHLSSFAKNKEKKGGYVLFTDVKTGKVYWVTVDWLYKGTFGKTDHELIFRPQNLRYEGKVFKVDAEATFNLIRLLNQGAHWSEHYAFDYDHKKVFKTKENVKQYNHTHISQKFPIPTQYLTDKKYRSIRPSYKWPSTDAPVSNPKDFEDLVDGELFSRYTMLFSDAFKINIWAEGESSRRAGFLAKIAYPTADQSQTNENKHFTGNHMIRNIRHLFQDNSYMQAITLVSDGYKQHGRDMVTW